jgi:tagatose 6-phosphate kinase
VNPLACVNVLKPAGLRVRRRPTKIRSDASRTGQGTRVIVTITLNAALGVSYEARQVAWKGLNEVTAVRHHAAGRGVAVARVLHTFGHEVLAAGLAGGAAGEMIREDLSRQGIPTEFTRIGHESRRVLDVRDTADGRVLSFTEPGPYITTEELGRFAADYRKLLAGATAVVLCGSLPDGIPAEIYGSLATYAAEAGVPAILDAGGEELRYGAARRPALVIPAADVPATALLAGGVGAVALVSDHAIQAVTTGGQWQAKLPGLAGSPWPRPAVVAGLIPGVLLGWSWEDRLRHAVALGASVGEAGEVDVAAYERLIAQVVVDPPEG